MRNSRGGLGGIPSPSRAGAPPKCARSHRAKVREQVCGRKSRPFRQREIAVYRTQPWCDLTPKRKRGAISLIGAEEYLVLAPIAASRGRLYQEEVGRQKTHLPLTRANVWSQNSRLSLA